MKWEWSYTVFLSNLLTLSFCRISYVDLFFQSLIFTSGCCSSSEAFGVLDCLLTFECFGRSNSSKLLNTGALKNNISFLHSSKSILILKYFIIIIYTWPYSSVSVILRKSSCSTTAPDINVWNEKLKKLKKMQNYI